MSEVITNWVLFDATADKQYIKKMMPEGVLAFFDSEEDAKRAKASNKGTDYKRIDRVKASDYDQLKAENERLKLRLWDLEHSEVDHVLKERDTLRKQLDEIRAEAELFFEWPGDDRSTVTLTSCILFADHIASPATKAVVMPSMDRCYEIATNTFGENMPQELAMKIALVIGVLMNEIESLNEGQKDEH